MANSTIWWLLAGAAVGVELVTGTFYLLMVAIGLAAGAIAAHLGFGPTLQLAVVAVVGLAATLVLRQMRGRQPASEPAESNRDVNLDVGERVQVDIWAADDTGRVNYRGASWQVRLAPGAIRAPGPHRVVAVDGSVLVVSPVTA